VARERLRRAAIPILAGSGDKLRVATGWTRT
jgi:hypothetical protein